MRARGISLIGAVVTLAGLGNLGCAQSVENQYAESPAESRAAAGAEALSPIPSIRTRLIVMADMGNEPDEEQQMTHLLLYANRVDLEGLIACSGKSLHADRTDGRTKIRPVPSPFGGTTAFPRGRRNDPLDRPGKRRSG